MRPLTINPVSVGLGTIVTQDGNSQNTTDSGNRQDQLKIWAWRIGKTRTESGLEIQAEWDENRYETGIKVTDEELVGERIERNAIHGDWNVTILPNQ